MACCACCATENGNNIVLEVVVLVLAPIFLFLQIALYINGYLLVSDVCLIVASALGIVALKKPNSYRLGWVTFGLSCIVLVPFIISLVTTIIGVVYFINEPGESIQKSVLAAIFAFAFIYIVFGICSSLALAIKHFKICRALRRNELNNPSTFVATTVQYDRPAGAGQPTATSYQSVGTHQPQPPVDVEKEKMPYN